MLNKHLKYLLGKIIILIKSLKDLIRINNFAFIIDIILHLS